MRLPGVARCGVIVGFLFATGCASSQRASLPTPQVPTPKAPAATAQTASQPASPASPAPSSSDTSTSSPEAGATGGARTPDEHRDALDQKLGTSLSAFDAMLLKEQQEAAQKRAEHAATAGSGAGGEGEGGSGSEGATGGAGASGSRRADRKSDERRGETKASSPGGRDGDRATGSSRGGDRSGGGGRTTTAAPEGQPSVPADNLPADVGDGRDDDVVARQIREAATKEEDPAIREKLWEEYRRYKASRPGSGT